MSFKLLIQKNLKWISNIFLFLGLVFCSLAVEFVDSGKSISWAYLLLGIGGCSVILSQIINYKIKPKEILVEERKNRVFWEKKVVFELDSIWIVFLTGVLAEFFSFFQFEYKIIAVIFYSGLSYSLYELFRNRISTFRWGFIFHFGFLLSMIAVSPIWQFPELLHEIGIYELSLSRATSFLTFLYLQIGLQFSTIITASRAYREAYLNKEKLSIADLISLQTRFIQNIDAEVLKENLRDIISDVAVLRESIIDGHFESTIGWGWSIILRMLDKLASTKESYKEKAERLGWKSDNFTKSYKIRNDTVHGGYRPNFNDAYSCLQLIREILTSNIDGTKLVL